MISRNLINTINRAYNIAKNNRYACIDTEQLLYALLTDLDVRPILEMEGIPVNQLAQGLKDYIEKNISLRDLSRPIDGEYRNLLTPLVQFIIGDAIERTEREQRNETTGLDVLLSIANRTHTKAGYLLGKFLDAEHLRRKYLPIHSTEQKSNIFDNEINQITQMIENLQDNPYADNEDDEPELFIERFTVNLNDEVIAGNIDPLIGRQDERQRMMQVLCRRHKNNPLLVGEAGVGKTALVEGLAWDIVNDQVPDVLCGYCIFSLDIGLIVAGSKYRGDLENRIKGVLHELDKLPKAILFIDEVHTIVGAGKTQNNTIDVAELLKPILARGKLRCIGATTYQEYQEIFDKNQALSRRFQKIDVTEPTVEETLEMLKGIQPLLEAHHAVTYTHDALLEAIKLSKRYIMGRFLPDKAIDILDEAGAIQQVLPPLKRQNTIGQAQIASIVAKIARIPEQQLTYSDKALLQGLAGRLKSRIFGQDYAIDVLVNTVKSARVGLGQTEKPIGSFLFAGPTGVGKTELARALAEELGITLIRFDMSEYREGNSVARFVGASPGYIGYEKGGLLTNAIYKQPYAILLLDEIEKAHPDIFNLLLQVMDYGSLTDNNGRRSDFHHIILIMTTNAGAESLSRSSIGFADTKRHLLDNKELEETFSPEFRNRLDGIISFSPLNQNIIQKITYKFLNQLATQLQEKGVQASFSPRLVQYVCQHGFNQDMGARPLDRLIKDMLRHKLADELLFGHLNKGGSIYIDIDENNQVVFLEESVVNHSDLLV